MDKPTVGRIVHYVLPSTSKSFGQHRAAIISRVYSSMPEHANLHVFTDQENDGHGFEHAVVRVPQVPYDERGENGTWHWPEREGDLLLSKTQIPDPPSKLKDARVTPPNPTDVVSPAKK